MNEVIKSKLTGNIYDDIDTVYIAVGYVKSLVDGLVEEEIAQNNENGKRIHIFLNMLEIQKYLRGAVENAKRMRENEKRYTDGPLYDGCCTPSENGMGRV